MAILHRDIAKGILSRNQAFRAKLDKVSNS